MSGQNNKKRKGKAEAPKKAKEINLVWFFVAATIAAFLFFSFSIWMRTPKEKIVHKATHLIPKKYEPKRKQTRNVRGYNVSY